MATIDSIPTGMQLPVLISLFARTAGASSDPEVLMREAKCIYSCVPVGVQMPVLIYLAFQIVASGISGVTGVYMGTTAQRNATTPPGTAAIWILTDSDPQYQFSLWNGSAWI